MHGHKLWVLSEKLRLQIYQNKGCSEHGRPGGELEADPGHGATGLGYLWHALRGGAGVGRGEASWSFPA